MKIICAFGMVMVLLRLDLSAQTVVDFDGNEYQTVVIGNQVWMAENLNSLHYSDGVPIDGVWAYEINPDTASIYGRLYTWDAAVKDTSSNSIPSGIEGASCRMAPSQHWRMEVAYRLSGSRRNCRGSSLRKRV